MRWRWTGALAVTLAVVAMVAAACSGSGDQSAATSLPRVVAVGPKIAATARSGDVSVEVPVGAVASPGRLGLVRTGVDLSGAPDGLTRISEPVGIQLTGTELTGTATIRFHDVTGPREPLIVVWHRPDGSWEWLPTRVTGSTATASTDHATGGFLARFDAGAWARGRADELAAEVTGRVGVAQPTCGDEQALRSVRVTVTAEGGDAVKWCAGIAGGRDIVRIANDRRTYTTVTYPSDWQVIDGDRHGIGLDALTRGGAAALQQRAAVPVGQTARLLGCGETLTLGMPSDPRGTVEVAVDAVAWWFSALSFGIHAEIGILNAMDPALGAAATAAVERFASELDSGDPTTSWTKALTGCLGSSTDTVADQPVQAAGSDLARFAWSCAPKMLSTDLGAAASTAPHSPATLPSVERTLRSGFAALRRATLGARTMWDAVAPVAGSPGSPFTLRVSTAAPAPQTDPGAGGAAGTDTPSGPTSSFDPLALSAFIASFPELKPTETMQGCQSIDLLSVDLGTKSAKVFTRFGGAGGCPGDPMETYVQIDNGSVTRTVTCAESDQTGQCAQFEAVRQMWQGRVVYTVDTWVCPGTSSGICLSTMRRTTRS